MARPLFCYPNFCIKTPAILISVLGLSLPVLAEDEKKEVETHLKAITITGTAEDRARASGSIHKVEEETLEQWHYKDVNRVLKDVPGVYIRHEDGYGLRPNIGMRGSDSNRSKKITLMEDAVLFAPAPYSAPAAYYFPMLPRMTSVEVYKGLSSIKYGPNSVGGAINFVSREIPTEYQEYGSGAIDLSVGSYGFNQLHAYYGNSYNNFGWMLEGVHMGSDGFKEIDEGGNSGFEKNDAVLKLRFNSDINADIYHQLDIKIGYANEESNETYLGLTDDDFDDNPNRRYVLSKYDKMEWEHKQFSINYFIDPGNDVTANTVIYRREFSRNWEKMNGFTGNAPLTSEILRDPYTPLHSVYYALMTGEESSSGPHDRVILEAKDRDFVSQGIQTQIDLEKPVFGYKNKLSIGIRYHEDEVTRDHKAREYEVVFGDIFLREDIAPRDTIQNFAKAQALSLFAFDEVIFGDLAISAGVRQEVIHTDFIDYTDNSKVKDDFSVLLPGAGFNYSLTKQLRILGGIHEGFVSVPPGSDEGVDPERSTNYELGFRYIDNILSGSVIGFYSDYSNLQGTCTFSLGCSAEDVDKGFNAGEVDIWGLETDFKATVTNIFNSRLDLPISLVYTYTDSEFQNSFSSPRPDLVDVKEGDKLPMLPEHLLTFTVGLSSSHWDTALSFNYVSEMRTTAGQGRPEKEYRTDSQKVVDYTVNIYPNRTSTLYFTIENVFNDQAIVARRPFGARPSKPRSLLMGFKFVI